MATCTGNLNECVCLTETASVPEVFIPLLATSLLLFMMSVWWWYRRRGESPFRANASRWQIAVRKLLVPLPGVTAVVFTVCAFLPGDLCG